MITEESTLTLGTLHAEILELKRSVDDLRALFLATRPEPDRPVTVDLPPSISFEEASEHVRSNYSHLLRKLSQ